MKIPRPLGRGASLMASARGMHKVEFFTHIDEIRSMYENGYVVLKILYNELQKKHNWSMSYWSFCKYMKEEIIAPQNDPTIQKSVTNEENAQSSTCASLEDMATDHHQVENQETKDPKDEGGEISKEEEDKILDEMIRSNPNLLDKYR